MFENNLKEYERRKNENTKSKKKWKKSNISENGITLVALVITIIMLLILSTIIIKAISNDWITTTAKEEKETGEISIETKIIDLSSIQARNMNRQGVIDEDKLKKALESNTGEGKVEVEEYKRGESYLVTFTETERKYEVTNLGEVKYIGTGDDIGIVIVQPRNITGPSLRQEVNVIVKTINQNNINEMQYAWNKNEREEPQSGYNYSNLKASTEEESINEKETTVTTPENLEFGDYYLWVKVANGEKEIIQYFGPYRIGNSTPRIIFIRNYSVADNNKTEQEITLNTNTQLKENSFTRTGYEFNEWNTAANGSGKSYQDKESVNFI